MKSKKQKVKEMGREAAEAREEQKQNAETVEGAETTETVEATETEVVEEEPETPAEPDLATQLAAAKETLLRKVAEFDNFRKRKNKEVEDARFFSKSSVISEFLTVFDHFKMAMQSVENGDDLNIVRQGMQMILTEFGRTFENLGVQEVDATGQPFDPQVHDAISHEASDEVAEDHVIKQWKSGYKLNDRVIRPATVVVSSGKAETEEAGAEG